MRGDDGQLRKACRHDIQVDRPGRVELDALAARLTRADTAGAGVKETRNLELGGFLPELEMPFITRIEVLHRRVELGTLRAQLFDGALQLLNRVRLPGIDRGEERESLGMAFDNPAHEVVGERRPTGRRLRIPGEQDPEDFLLGTLDSELVDAPLVHLAAEVAGRRLAGGTHAGVEPFLQREMDMQVDGADQATRPVALLLPA